MRTVTFEIDDATADRIEELEECSVEEVALRLIKGYLQDGRRQLKDMKTLGIAWPTDWYERALREWGERNIASNIRRVVFSYLEEWYPNITQIEVYRDYETTKVTREVKPNPGRQSTIQTVLVPQDWYEAILSEFGGGNVSTFVKSLIYKELTRMARRGDDELSVPRRLGKYLK